MKKKIGIQISILAVLFLALGVEAWAQCGCRQRCNHNQAYNRYRGLENHPQFAVSARSPANVNYNSNGVPVRYVEPVNQGYGYNGYNGYGYNGYGNQGGYYYNNRGNYYNQGYYNQGYRGNYNRGNCGQRARYRGW